MKYFLILICVYIIFLNSGCNIKNSPEKIKQELSIEKKDSSKIFLEKALYYLDENQEHGNVDLVKAEYYLKRSIELNYIPALQKYGIELIEGNFFKQDTKLGIDILKKAISLGDYYSILFLSNYYFRINNYIKSIELLEFGDKSNYSLASYYLYNIYMEGVFPWQRGSKENYNLEMIDTIKASSYLKNAANKYYEAQLKLGKYYFYGFTGIDKDEQKAKEFFNKAVNNNEISEEELIDIESYLKRIFGESWKDSIAN